jgi:alpha-D-ribose 1-methylphosphonate 5-triphosphate diphosphatase
MPFQPSDAVFTNARIILPEQEVIGWLAVENGMITEIGEGAAPDKGHDLGGDILMPGLVELHTDNLESHLKPRPKVTWPKLSSVISYDSQLVTAGITTVFDSLRAGNDADYAPAAHELNDILMAIEEARERRLLRADHRLHLRCEICSPDVIEQAGDIVSGHKVNLISLMDHTPGARQFLRIEAWKTYYGGKSGLGPEKLEELMARKHQ